MTLPSERQKQIQQLIQSFLQERLQGKLAKLSPDDPKRDSLIQEFAWPIWVADAARRVSQIQAVTHALKPIHSRAIGSSLYKRPADLPVATPLLNSQVLGAALSADVVGDAAALDVYKFLKLRLADGPSLLDLALAADADLVAVLHPDVATAQAQCQAFAGLVQRDTAGVHLASHNLAKQLYWPLSPTSAGAHDDQNYHLLAPLYPTSLVQAVYERIQQDRFGEAAKVARAARKQKLFSAQPVHDYPDLAVQQLGGSNPQNISQLNSERGGQNFLFASLPPIWHQRTVRPILHIHSLFRVFEKRSVVKRIISGWGTKLPAQRGLKPFLDTNPPPNQATRQWRDAHVAHLLAEFIQFSLQIHTLEPGWSQDPACQLPQAQRQWLDPQAYSSHPPPGVATQVAPTGPERAADKPSLVALSPDQLLENIAQAFAQWLNDSLRDPLPMGEEELRFWCKKSRAELKDFVQQESVYAD